MRWLVFGLLLCACSGNTDGGLTASGWSGSSGGTAPLTQAGASAGAEPLAAHAGGSGASASSGSAPTAAAGRDGAGATAGSGGTTGGGGSGGALTVVVGGAGASQGGSPASGTGGETQIGGSAGSGGAGESEAGGEGGAPMITPDPCEGVKHWSPTDKITDYTPRPSDADGSWQGDLRVFGGILWAAQAASGCQTYPGRNPGYEGWLEIATCAGGPINETAACQCASGACCDGCYLRPSSYFCGEVVRAVRCSSGGEEGDYWDLFCDGLSGGDCKRWGAHSKYANGSCASGVTCQSSSAETACSP
jgi:hypothetical protein